MEQSISLSFIAHKVYLIPVASASEYHSQKLTTVVKQTSSQQRFRARSLHLNTSYRFGKTHASSTNCEVVL